MYSNYRGESPSKKQARISLWSHVESALGRPTFVRGPHLVIASQEAGDVSTLLAMGVTPNRIHAVDIDPHAIAAAKHKFQGSGVAFANIDFRAAQSAFSVKQYASAFIDMCAPIRESIIDGLKAINTKVLAYEFMCGRELGEVIKFLDKYIVKYPLKDEQDRHPAEPRIAYLESQGIPIKLAFYYVSATILNQGVPMCTVIRGREGKAPGAHIVPVRLNEVQLRKLLVASKDKNTPDLYNVSRPTVHALKAWETRWKGG